MPLSILCLRTYLPLPPPSLRFLNGIALRWTDLWQNSTTLVGIFVGGGEEGGFSHIFNGFVKISTSLHLHSKIGWVPFPRILIRTLVDSVWSTHFDVRSPGKVTSGRRDSLQSCEHQFEYLVHSIFVCTFIDLFVQLFTESTWNGIDFLNSYKLHSTFLFFKHEVKITWFMDV